MTLPASSVVVGYGEELNAYQKVVSELIGDLSSPERVRLRHHNWSAGSGALGRTPYAPAQAPQD